MKKRILSLLLAALMIFSLLPTMALAETTQNCQGGDDCTHKAAIGTTHYETLAAAIAAVPTNGTETEIIMIDDETIEGNTGVTIGEGQNVVLDLNGHTVKNAVNENKASQVITNKGTLTIKDTSDSSNNGTGEGLLTNDVKEGTNAGEWWSTPQYNYATNVILNNGTLIVKSGKILETAASSICYSVDNNSSAFDAVFTIEGGLVIKESGTAVRMFCNSTTKENTINVSGGEISGGYSGIWVQLPGNSAQKKKATLNVSGGTLTGDYAFYDYSYGDLFDEVEYNLSNGTFNGAVFSYGANTHITGGIYNGSVYVKDKTGFISGGTFNDNVKTKWGYVYLDGDDVYDENENYEKADKFDSPWDKKAYWEENGYIFEQYSGEEYTVYYYAKLDESYIANYHVKVPSTVVTDKENYVDVVPNYVAQIGEKKYLTLNEALAEATTGTANNPIVIEVLADAEAPSTITANNVKIVGTGETKPVITKLSGIGSSSQNLVIENLEFNQTATLNINGTNTVLRNCKIYTKNLSTKLSTIDGSNTLVESCAFEGISSGSLGLAPVYGTNVTVKDCTFNNAWGGCYYSTAKGTWIIDGCTFTNIGCYCIHTGECKADVVVKNTKIDGWCSFGSSVNSLTFNNCIFDKTNGTYYSIVRPYIDATFTNCKFTEGFVEWKDTTYGDGIAPYVNNADELAENVNVDNPSVATLNGCYVITADGKISTKYTAVDAANPEDGGIVAVDAAKDTNGKYTAGTFVFGNHVASNAIEAAEGYQLTKIKDNVYTITEEAKVKEGKIISGTDEEGKPKEIEVKGTGEGEGEGKPTAEQAAQAITQTLDNPEVANFTETEIEEATEVTEQTTIQNVDQTGFNLSMILDAVKEEAAKKFESSSGEATVTNNGEITVKPTDAGDGEKFVDTDVSKQIKVDLTAAEVRQEQSASTNTTVTSMTFDVKPIATIVVTNGENTETVTAVIPNEAITSPITFRLPVNSSITAKTAAVYHEGVLMGIYEIKEENNNKFIEVSSDTFSLYSYVILDALTAAAKIGDTYYPTLADAVKEASGKTIVVLKDTDETVIVERAMSFEILGAEGVTKLGNIKPGDHYRKYENGSEYTFRYYETGDTIVIGGKKDKDTKTETKEENPETGAPVLSMSTGIVLAGIALVLAKRK